MNPSEVSGLLLFVILFTNLCDVIFTCYRIVIMVISKVLILVAINLHAKARESEN